MGWNFKNTKEEQKNGDNMDVTKKEELNNSNFDFALLFGTGKNGFKLGIAYTGNNTQVSDINTILTGIGAPTITDASDFQSVTNDKTKNNLYNYLARPYFKFGTEVAAGDYILKPYAGIQYEADVAKIETAVESGDKLITTVIDGTTRNVGLFYGTNIDFGKKGNYAHNLTIDGTSKFYIFPKTLVSTTGDEATQYISKVDGASMSENEFDFIYNGTYAATEKLSLGFNASTTFNFTSETGYKSSTTTTGTDTTNNNIAYNKNGSFEINNAIAAGLTYQIKKNIALNIGAGITLPQLSRTTEKSYDADGNLTSSESIWAGTDSACTLNLTSGAKFTINDVVTIDLWTDVLNNILDYNLTDNNYSTAYADTDGSDKFWANINKIVFPSFSLQVSTKF